MCWCVSVFIASTQEKNKEKNNSLSIAQLCVKNTWRMYVPSRNCSDGRWQLKQIWLPHKDKTEICRLCVCFPRYCPLSFHMSVCWLFKSDSCSSEVFFFDPTAWSMYAWSIYKCICLFLWIIVENMRISDRIEIRSWRRVFVFQFYDATVTPCFSQFSSE